MAGRAAQHFRMGPGVGFKNASMEFGPIRSAVAEAPVVVDTNLSNVLTGVIFNRRAKNTNGQVLPNNIVAPADGSAQTAYDTFLGTTASSNETIDPVFAQSSGGTPAMIIGDNNDTMQISAVLTPARLKNLGSGPDWSYVGLFYASASAHGGAEIFLQSGGNSSAFAGLSLRYASTQVRISTADGTTANSFNFPTSALPVSSYYQLVVTYSPTSRAAKCYINKATAPSTGTNTAGLAAVSTQGSIAFGAHAAGHGFIEDGLVDHIMTDAEVALVRDFYETKYAIELFN